MKKSIQATILASMLTAGMALPAMAVPQGPPSFILDTEQAYSMTPLAAYLGGGMGGLTLRNGMPGNWEWWLRNADVTLTPSNTGAPFGIGGDLGAKVMFIDNQAAGFAGAFYGDIDPNYGPAITATGTAPSAFALNGDVGLAFSQMMVFGNATFAPNLALGSLTTGATETLNFNVAVISPLGGGWLLMLQDVPHYNLNGGGFGNDAKVGARFWPARNAALDLTLADLGTTSAGTVFVGGIVGAQAYVGF
jgi:hypothetical protein